MIFPDVMFNVLAIAILTIVIAALIHWRRPWHR